MKKDTTYRRWTPRGDVFRRFSRNKPALAAMLILVFLLLIAILAPVLSNERPLYAVYHGKTFFPAFHPKKTYVFVDQASGDTLRLQNDITDWKRVPLESVLWAPVRYSPGKPDEQNKQYKSPSAVQKFIGPSGEVADMPPAFRHWLGTGKRGEDLLSGLIHGTRISLSIGIVSMGIAAAIGLVLGAMGGYFGDNGLKFTLGRWIFLFPGCFFGYFYGFHLRAQPLSEALTAGSLIFLGHFLLSVLLAVTITCIFWWLGALLSKWHPLSRKMAFPLDSLVNRLMEILSSLPKIIFIITLAAVADRSLWNVMIIIGITSWTGIARLTRAEILRVKSMDYIQAARALGVRRRWIILKHALPNAAGPAMISIAFGVAAAILAESSLSFLGIGVPRDVVTWGSLLSNGKENFMAWWLVIFPGAAIFLTITAYNLLGEGLRDALDPRLKERQD